MEKIFDWKGNEIKAGMTIYFVQTKPGFLVSSRMGLLIPQTGKMIWEKEENWIKRRDEDIWELGKPREVTQENGRLYITERFNDPDIELLTQPLSDAFMWDAKPTIAIKGISETK